jgi:thiamine-phosphate pyrophosphorylase
VECALAMAEGGARVVQLRAKSWGSGAMLRAAECIKRRLSENPPQLFINDRADVAAAVEATGVHVGQEDLPPRRLGGEFPRLLIGLSTHDEMQLDAALADDCLTYVAFGPVFPTHSKAHAEADVGVARLAEAYRKARKSRLPLVAIGGISEGTLPAVAQACDLVAMIGHLLPERGASRPYTAIRERVSRIGSDLATWGIGEPST